MSCFWYYVLAKDHGSPFDSGVRKGGCAVTYTNRRSVGERVVLALHTRVGTTKLGAALIGTNPLELSSGGRDW